MEVFKYEFSLCRKGPLVDPPVKLLSENQGSYGHQVWVRVWEELSRGSLGVERVYCQQHRFQGTVKPPTWHTFLPASLSMALWVPTDLRSEFSLLRSFSHGADLAVLVWARLGCAPGRACLGEEDS